MSGCTQHRAFIYDRGAERKIGELFPLTQIRWDRVRDDTSSGNIYMQRPDPSCHKMIAEIEPGRHEMVIFRDGVRMWEGPVVRTAERGRQLEVDARDITHYINRTIMRSGYSNAYPRVTHGTERLRKILTTELARMEYSDPPVNILPFLEIRTHAQTAKTSRVTLPYEKYVFEEMDDMAAKSGLDYTVIGRRLLINDVHDNIGEGPMLTEVDFDGDLTISSYGMELCTFSAVTDGEGRWGSFGGRDDYYGIVEILHTAFGESTESNYPTPPTKTADMTQKEWDKAKKEYLTAVQEYARRLREQAERNMAGRYPTPILLRVPDNSTLRPQTAEKIMDYLIPGVRFKVRATNAFKPFTQVQKLDKVSFEEDDSGERISVVMSPAPGVTPWDAEGETSEEEQA